MLKEKAADMYHQFAVGRRTRGSVDRYISSSITHLMTSYHTMLTIELYNSIYMF